MLEVLEPGISWSHKNSAALKLKQNITQEMSEGTCQKGPVIDLANSMGSLQSE